MNWQLSVNPAVHSTSMGSPRFCNGYYYYRPAFVMQAIGHTMNPCCKLILWTTGGIFVFFCNKNATILKDDVIGSLMTNAG